MSFLYYDDKTPDTKAIFKSLKADEYLVKDSGTGDYIPLSGGGGGGNIPYYLKPNSVEIAGEGTNTVLDSNSIDVNDIAGNTGSSLTSTALTFGDSGGNTALAKPGVTAANKLSTAILGAVNTAANANQSLILWDSGSETLKRSNIIRLSNSASVYNTFSPTALSMVDSTSLTNIQGNLLATVNGGRQLVRITNGGVTVGTSTATPADFALDSSQPYITVGSAGVAFKTSSTTHNLLKEDVAVTNQLKALTAATPVGTSKMVTFNTATSAFGHADIPSAAAVAPKTYFKIVSISNFTDITFNSAVSISKFNYSGNKPCMVFKNLNQGDKVVLKCSNLPYNIWLPFTIQGYFSPTSCVSIVATNFIPSNNGNTVEVSTMCNSFKPTPAGTTVDFPSHWIAFKLIHDNAATGFSGYLTITYEASDTGTLDNLVTEDYA